MNWRERLEKRRLAESEEWARHLAALDAKKYGRADRLARRLLGVHRDSVQMSEEVKAKLKSPEYQERARLRRLEKAEIKKRVKEIASANNTRTIRRKR